MGNHGGLPLHKTAGHQAGGRICGNSFVISLRNLKSAFLEPLTPNPESLSFHHRTHRPVHGALPGEVNVFKFVVVSPAFSHILINKLISCTLGG